MAALLSLLRSLQHTDPHIGILSSLSGINRFIAARKGIYAKGTVI